MPRNYNYDHLDLIKLCRYEFLRNDKKNRPSDLFLMPLPRHWEKMYSDDKRKKNKDMYANKYLSAYWNAKTDTIAIVVNFDFDSDYSEEDNHSVKDILGRLDSNLGKIQKNYADADKFVRDIHLVHSYRIFAYVLYCFMTGSFDYWGEFLPKIIITGFKENGSLAEMIALSYGVEAVSFESCGVPIKDDSSLKAKDNIHMTRYVLPPNLTNTQFPIPSGEYVKTYCMLTVDIEPIKQKIAELQKASFSVSSRTASSTKELIAHGISHSLDHLAISRLLKELIRTGLMLEATAGYYRLACGYLTALLIHQREYLPQDFVFQMGMASAPSGHVGKILGELLKRSDRSNIKVFISAFDTLEGAGIAEAIEVTSWPRQRECLNLESRREINLMVNRVVPTKTYFTQISDYVLGPPKS